MKKLLSLVLAAALTLSLTAPAFAMPTPYPDNSGYFPKVQNFEGYSDVASTDWFYTNVGICTEIGLMKGTDAGFNPTGVLTRAEVVTLAARISATIKGNTINTDTDGAWYQPYADYLLAEDGVALVPALETNATRENLIVLLVAVLPDELLTPINDLTAFDLPDVADGRILKAYNAGILTGTDELGTFDGDKTLTRAEAAAMIARVARDTLRLTFSPATLCETLLGLPDDTILFSDGAGMTVTLGESLPYVVQGISEIAQLMASYGMAFDPNLQLQDGNTTAKAAMDYIVQQAILSAWAESLLPDAVLSPEGETLLDTYIQSGYWRTGFTPDTIRATLLTAQRLETLALGYNDPADFQAWQDTNGKLCAKHILVADLETAQSLYDQLTADPTQFDALMVIHSQDPGSKTHPQGYVFGPGEMVAEFEIGTAALDVGQISQPIQSQFGYHIILRLDYPIEGYQAEKLTLAFDTYLNSIDPETKQVLDPTALDWMGAYNTILSWQNT